MLSVGIKGNLERTVTEDLTAEALGSGLLKNEPLEITNNSGLTERYLSKGIPTIHLLNVRALCEQSGIPFDPETLPKIGTAAMYVGTGYPRSAVLLWVLAALSGVLAAALLAPGRKRERQETVSGRMKRKLTLHALVALPALQALGDDDVDLIVVDGLREEDVGANAVAVDTALHIGKGGHQDDRRLLRAGILLQFTAYFVARQAAEHDVQQDDVGLFLPGQVEAGKPVFR